MKQLLLLLWTLSLGFRLDAQSPPIFHPNDLTEIAADEAKAYLGKINPPTLAASGDYDVRYQRMKWQIDPAIRYIRGEITTYFVPKINDFAAVHFDLMDSMRVDSIDYHGAVLTFTHSDNVLTINLPGLLPAGAPDSLTVFYQGDPPTSGFGSFIQDVHANTPIIWTLSEPYGARDWWPCKQDLTDKIDSIDVLVTCPDAYRAAGNGLLVSETVPAAGLKTYHWKHRYPIACYLVALAVTNYVQYSDYAEIQTGTLPILNYVFPESLTDAQAGTANVVPVLEFYDSLFIPYPFHREKYGHAQFGWGGGQEHQTMSYVVNFGYELLAHELAHQWFGDHVTCGTWTDIWLNEGFATYLSGLSYQRFGSAASWFGFKQGRIASVVSQPDGSVRVDDTTNVGRIFNGRLSYAKGAMVLHMLRWTLGDSVFFSSIRNYLNTPGLAGGFAHTNDLRSTLEATSGQDLSGFFNDWYSGQGYPSYHLDWSQSGSNATVTLFQSQSHPSVPFFEVPVPLRFKQGNQTFDVRLQPTASGQSFQLTLPFIADELQFDPDLWLISANNTVSKVIVATQEQVVAQAEIFPNPASGRVTVSLGAESVFDDIRVFNAQGQMILRMHTDRAATAELDLSGLPSGLYAVEIYGTDKLGVGTVVKE